MPEAFIPDDIQIVTPYENLIYGIYGQSLEVYHDVVWTIVNNLDTKRRKEKRLK